MLLLENILLALNGVRANKMRSMLTMLGIIIGIASVIAIMTVGTSMSGTMADSMNSMGASNITLGVSQKSSSTETTAGGMRFNWGPHSSSMSDEDYLTDEMLANVKEKYPENVSEYLLTESIGSAQALDGELYANINVKGANNESIENDDLTILAGRTFTDKDQKGKKVCIVSDYLCNNMFSGDTSAALGQELSVKINNVFYHYSIVGVYEYDNSGTFSSSSEEETSTDFYIPLQTAFDQEHVTPRYSQVTVVTQSGTDVDTFMEEMESYINSRFYRNNDSFEVSCSSMTSMLESLTETMNTIAMAISFIAGISLLVGGIGVMNIMLVSIQERTKEIGTRKALGATNGSIRTQFIVESIVLCLVGGFIGIVLGIGIGYAASKQMGYEAYPPVTAIIFSVAFSMAIGIFFGYYPANKAAKMNPVDALRYE